MCVPSVLCFIPRDSREDRINTTSHHHHITPPPHHPNTTHHTSPTQVNLCGRGDKDMMTVAKVMGVDIF
jgi:tryptophan synthase beta subunit